MHDVYLCLPDLHCGNFSDLFPFPGAKDDREILKSPIGRFGLELIIFRVVPMPAIPSQVRRGKID